MKKCGNKSCELWTDDFNYLEVENYCMKYDDVTKCTEFKPMLSKQEFIDEVLASLNNTGVVYGPADYIGMAYDIMNGNDI